MQRAHLTTKLIIMRAGFTLQLLAWSQHKDIICKWPCWQLERNMIFSRCCCCSFPAPWATLTISLPSMLLIQNASSNTLNFFDIFPPLSICILPSVEEQYPGKE